MASTSDFRSEDPGSTPGSPIENFFKKYFKFYSKKYIIYIEDKENDKNK